MKHDLPLNNPKNQNSEKMEKTPADIIILHKYIKNHDHMLHCSWDTMPDGYNSYFSFWAIFCTFSPLTTQNIKVFKKWKKCLETSQFYTCVPKVMVTWCTVPEIRCTTDGWKDGKSDIEVGGPPKNLNRVIEAVRKSMSIRKAAMEYDIKRSTLHDHVKEKRTKKVGIYLKAYMWVH